MKRKKSQAHITETILVLAVFLILAIIVFSAYSGLVIGSAEDEQAKALDFEAIKSAKSVSSLPELQCSVDGITENDCIDYFKLKAASVLMRDSKQASYYFGRFGFGKISARQVYPKDEEIIIYSNSLADYSYKNTINVPVSIFYPDQRTYSFWIITVERLSK